jgi:nucleoside-diphosphate-sugar epimerase
MRLVIIGYGYSSAAIHHALAGELESLTVTCRTLDKAKRLKAQGIEAVVFDGTGPSSALAGALASATHIVQSAAPSAAGDPLLVQHDLGQVSNLRWAGYLSTVGVYGNHDGAVVDESAELRPVNKRAQYRASAEETWLGLANQLGFACGVFRLGGIYGPGRSALDKLRAGTARRIIKPGQVFSRIHVDDIGRVVAASAKVSLGGAFNVTDDEPAPPQDVIAHAADLLGVDVPPGIAFEQADLSPTGRSFYSDNKRVSNTKIRKHFGSMLYPTYREGLASLV